MTTEAIRPAARHHPWYKVLYVQVLIEECADTRQL